MKTSDYTTILMEESFAALGVILGAVIGILLDNLILGLLSAAGLLIIARATTCRRIKNRNQ